MSVPASSRASERRDFIRDIITADNASGKHGGRVATRFPPEPNGYLHIGHAKSICLNFGIARDFAASATSASTTRTRSPRTSSTSTRSRQTSSGSASRGTTLFYASDYFEQLYDCAERLIRDGKAYVDDLHRRRDSRAPRHADGARPREPVARSPRRREPRSLPPHARRRVPRRLARAAREDRHGSRRTSTCATRCCIASAAPTITGPATRGASTRCTTTRIRSRDAIERITHSICTLEFEDHRPLYDWSDRRTCRCQGRRSRSSSRA